MALLIDANASNGMIDFVGGMIGARQRSLVSSFISLGQASLDLALSTNWNSVSLQYVDLKKRNIIYEALVVGD